jgi:hypothetical protein
MAGSVQGWRQKWFDIKDQKSSKSDESVQLMTTEAAAPGAPEIAMTVRSSEALRVSRGRRAGGDGTRGAEGGGPIHHRRAARGATAKRPHQRTKLWQLGFRGATR